VICGDSRAGLCRRRLSLELLHGGVYFTFFTSWRLAAYHVDGDEGVVKLFLTFDFSFL
jgi:hypothetical protein